MSITKSVYDFTSYREYLRHLVAAHSERGYQSRLAQRAGCHPSFLSQVLGGKGHLSQDHAIGISDALALSPEETEYLLALLEGERAGTPALRRYYTRRRNELRLRPPESAIAEQRLRSEPEEAFYYGRWYRPAIHLLLETREYANSTAIAERLGIEKLEVESVIEEFERMGLVERDRQRWRVRRSSVHLSPGSAAADLYQATWRSRASLALPRPESLRYTGLHTVARRDVAALRAQLVDTLAAFRAKVAESPPEELIAFTLDFFEVGKC